MIILHKNKYLRLEVSKEKVILCVSNDLATDQRVQKVCNSLTNNQYDVLFVGRKLKNSLPINLPYKTKRLSILFNKGFLFYAFLNIQLFFYLLFKKATIFIANDIDTLPAVRIVSFLKNKKYLVDLHELFTEVPEVYNRPRVKKFWTFIENTFLKGSKRVITVCDSIANHYNEKLQIKVQVVRNIPIKDKNTKRLTQTSDKTIIYQGAINIGRGLENLVKTMEFLPEFKLWIIGSGDIYKDLELQIKNSVAKDRIQLFGKMHPNKLINRTPKATLGISLEENMGLNYYYALPNKLFDYLRAEIPVLVSPFPEMEAIVNNYGIGYIATNKNPEQLALQIRNIHKNKADYQTKKSNCKKAKEELYWEKEFKTYLDLLKS